VLDDALTMFAILRQRGLMHPGFAVKPRAQQNGHEAGPAQAFYSDSQRELAKQGRLSELPLAPALESFTERLNARCLGLPALHGAFPRWVIPMVVDVNHLPDRLLAIFARSARAAAGSPTPNEKETVS
jgi:hypothetical protein